VGYEILRVIIEFQKIIHLIQSTSSTQLKAAWAKPLCLGIANRASWQLGNGLIELLIICNRRLMNTPPNGSKFMGATWWQLFG
jgi:hypothetical protein